LPKSTDTRTLLGKQQEKYPAAISVRTAYEPNQRRPSIE
jgi:hypothetical protein